MEHINQKVAICSLWTVCPFLASIMRSKFTLAVKNSSKQTVFETVCVYKSMLKLIDGLFDLSKGFDCINYIYLFIHTNKVTNHK